MTFAKTSQALSQYQIINKLGWNVSSSVDLREMRHKFWMDEQLALHENKLINPALMEAREKRKGKYLKPIERTIKQIKDMERTKEEEKALREKIRAEVADKANSKERNDAIVFKYFNDKKRFDTLLENVIKLGLLKHTIENQGQESNREAGYFTNQARLENIQVLSPRKMDEICSRQSRNVDLLFQ
eukprot:TRINITY_DN2441_c0_g1_i1.p4 TRINITY_DN2441_c0_g1~~TRINITY_DN2441_c0_g1_i1.p4  ORF type:complete len:186 (+),score=28.97 TRINITY_DN2441_c0_g1_i1:3751-4308(+)